MSMTNILNQEAGHRIRSPISERRPRNNEHPQDKLNYSTIILGQISRVYWTLLQSLANHHGE
jgi:hypothetical protein